MGKEFLGASHSAIEIPNRWSSFPHQIKALSHHFTMDYFWGSMTLLTPGFGSELQRMKLSGIHVQIFSIIC